MLKTLLLLVSLLTSLTYADDAAKPEAMGEKGEIKRFRFQRHGKQEFERLVMEFEGKGLGKGNASVKVTPQATEKNVLITVDKFTLVGAIPEAAMNESFTGRSKYLGPLAINTDTPNTISIKASLKEQQIQVDAFWLSNPSRLVVDAFPASSPRAAGPAILNSRKTAGATAKAAANTAKPVKKTKKLNVVCFPTESQVVASTSFDDPAAKMGLRIETDGSFVSPPNAANQGRVACFPKETQLKVKVKITEADSTTAAVERGGPKGPEEPVAQNAPVSPKAPEPERTVTSNDAAPAVAPAVAPAAAAPAERAEGEPEHPISP